ncbi:LLM class F420-dependent oxidoreductase [Minwuia thermotolerans]|uniref:LLM class F420-dependent oxidoreductase n=1 Tax=Minwuia thermotolerans TaxID=2056226 RepID=UPI000D6DC3A2|nr:LLM class F420-dependent oxidoreductase [Minwuia thermotolerans]
MQYGFPLIPRGPMAEPEALAETAQAGERLGFTHAMVPDHLVMPWRIESTYAYAADGRFPDSGESGAGAWMDTLTLAAFLAGCTSTLRLATSVLVIPHRPALLAAKMLASIDNLSRGRLTVGCGTGWMREEFEALQADPYDERGAVTNEYLDVFRTVWTNEIARYDGRYVRFGDVSTLPLPVQKPHPPLWIGGESAPALRRVVSYGDGWFPIGTNQRLPMDTHARIATRLARLKGLAEAAGRDPATITLAYWVYPCRIGGEVKNADGERMIMTGSADTVAEDVARMAAAGFSHLMINFSAPAPGAMRERMARFMEDVAPKAAA